MFSVEVFEMIVKINVVLFLSRKIFMPNDKLPSDCHKGGMQGD